MGLSMSMCELTSERLREVVVYDHETGLFWPKKTRPGIRKWQPLGHVESNGYRRIMIDGHRRLAHRLVWLYVTGEWPASDLDHRNGRPDDNRFENLRLATRKQNSANTRPRGSSGLKGAVFNRFRGHWQSYITINGKSKWLGRFDTAEDAHAAYMRAAIELHGDFVRGTT